MCLHGFSHFAAWDSDMKKNNGGVFWPYICKWNIIKKNKNCYYAVFIWLCAMWKVSHRNIVFFLFLTCILINSNNSNCFFSKVTLMPIVHHLPSTKQQTVTNQLINTGAHLTAKKRDKTKQRAKGRLRSSGVQKQDTKITLRLLPICWVYT